MKRIFLSSLGVNLFVMLLNISTGTLTARLLGPYGRGELAVATRWSGLFVIIFTVGLPGAVIYLGKQLPERRRSYFSAYLVLASCIGILGMALGVLAMPHLLQKQPREVVYLARLAMISVPFGVVADGLVGSLQGLNQFNKVMLIRVINELGTLIVILGLLLFGLYGIKQFILSNIAWSIGVFLVTLIWAWRAVHPKLVQVTAHAKDLFKKGIQIYAGSIVNIFGGNLDQLVISLFLSPYTLGLYAVCVSISGMVPTLISGTIQLFLWPKLMDLSPEARRGPVEQLHSSLAWGALFLSLIGGSLLPFVLPLMYGHRYVQAVPMGELLLLGAPLSVGYMVLVNYLSTLGRFNVVTVAEVLGLVVGLAATFPLSHIWGGVGAAISVLATVLVKWIFATVMSIRYGISTLKLLWPQISGLTSLMSPILKRRLLAKTE